MIQYYNSVIITHINQFKDMFSYDEYNVVKSSCREYQGKEYPNAR